MTAKSDLFAQSLQVYHSTRSVLNEQRFNYALQRLHSSSGVSPSNNAFGDDGNYGSGDVLLGLSTAENWSKWVPQLLIDSLKTTESYLIYKKNAESPLVILAKDESGLVYGSEQLVRDSLYRRSQVYVLEQPEMLLDSALRHTFLGTECEKY